MKKTGHKHDMARALLKGFNRSQTPFFKVRDDLVGLKAKMSEVDLGSMYTQTPGFHLEKITDKTYEELEAVIKSLFNTPNKLIAFSKNVTRNLMDSERYAEMKPGFLQSFGRSAQVVMPGANVAALKEWIPKFMAAVTQAAHKHSPEHSTASMHKKSACKIVGLKSRKDLNKSNVTVLEYNEEKARVHVRTDGGQEVYVKPKNLQVHPKKKLGRVTGLKETATFNGQMVLVNKQRLGDGRYTISFFSNPEKSYKIKSKNITIFSDEAEAKHQAKKI